MKYRAMKSENVKHRPESSAVSPACTLALTLSSRSSSYFNHLAIEQLFLLLGYVFSGALGQTLAPHSAAVAAAARVSVKVGVLHIIVR